MRRVSNILIMSSSGNGKHKLKSSHRNENFHTTLLTYIRLTIVCIWQLLARYTIKVRRTTAHHIHPAWAALQWQRSHFRQLPVNERNHSSTKNKNNNEIKKYWFIIIYNCYKKGSHPQNAYQSKAKNKTKLKSTMGKQTNQSHF